MHKQSAYILVLAVAVLITLGLVMLYSTGAFAPDSHGDQFNFLKKQSFWLGVGFIFSILFALLDYHRLERSWYVMYPFALGLLALCFIRPIGMRLNGSCRCAKTGGSSTRLRRRWGKISGQPHAGRFRRNCEDVRGPKRR